MKHQVYSLILASVALVSLLTGCATSQKRELVLVPPPVAEPRKPDLQLADASTQVELPERIDRNSPRDVAMAASYLAQQKPAVAARQYERLIQQHGSRYEIALTRNAYQDALKCAWSANDPALIRKYLAAYDQLDVVDRAGEPKFVDDLRRLFGKSDNERIRLAYHKLDAKLTDVGYDILRKRRSKWLQKHEAAILDLVRMYREGDPSSWKTDRLTDLVEAEVNLMNGYVAADSELLLYREADERARKADRTSDAAYIGAVVQTFLTRAGLVSEPGGQEFVLGRDYQAR